MCIRDRSELRRVHEDRDDDVLAVRTRRAHERKVPFVKRAHRRHERDRAPRCARFVAVCTQLFRSPYDHRGHDRSIRMRLGAVTWLCCGVLLTASLAHADPTASEAQAARELFKQAEADEDAGKWEEALDKVKRAISVKPTPGLRFHIALCEEKLGQLVAALADYTAADQMAREQNNKDVIDAVAEPLKTLRIRVPTLTIEVPAAQGSQVELDGKPIAQGLYGVAMPVEPGTHKVTARAPGKRL